ncbi:TetR/AcrR family transcriptional regulator [Nannocystis punicea]|uniref:TetR family transcriptional regulator n=1 Tax=Nannocystis punicea TaxID=2995304 RepID=A0ABY7HCN7_9BACT|nr:TetR family transcriptional regulator [Nannocystis poenicansa]WAS96961.1 TetR family transcriptional regulator [Nannocystis poenicansa]
MPRERFYNLSPEARARLLGVAMREFAERGLEGASLNAILAAAGLSKGAYYYYFEDKEDLFVTAIAGALDEVLARLSLPDFERLKPAEYWPALERAVATWSELFESSRELLRASQQLDAARLNSPRFAAVLDRGRALWRRLIAAGQRLGCVRTDVPLEALVRMVEVNDHALDEQFRAEHGGGFTRRDFEAHVRLVFDTFRRLLAVDAAATPAGGRAAARKKRAR